MIQFEPAWFRKKAPYAPSGLWSLNKVDVQSKEWLAFNNAFSKNPNAAMLSTSIGIGQIMGFHYNLLGYKTVGEMWDDAKKSIEAQLTQMVKFIESDKALKKALISHDWTTAAIHYNGAGFRDIAKKYKRDPYDVSLKKAYEKYKSIV